MITDKDLVSVQEARNLLKKASEAKNELLNMDRRQIDDIVRAMAEAGRRHAEPLAQMAVEETGFGIAADKVTKNIVATKKLYEFIKEMKTVGILRHLEEKRIIEVGVPMGVVFGITPSTNPTSTAMYKIIISVKARNGIVISPHPAAVKCTMESTRILAEAAQSAGAPADLISCMTTPTMSGTKEAMQNKATSVILATGGTGLVRSAYSSGKPAFGVGPGNVPAFIERTADVPRAVRDIIAGKTFDNGTVCASEQAAVVEEPLRKQAIDEFIRNKCYFLKPDEIDKVGKVLILPTGGINPGIVGKSAPFIAQKAGINVPSDTKALIACLDGVGPEYPLSCEKLSPVLAFYTVHDWQKGCELCIKLLEYGGMGHTLAIHSKNRKVILEFGLKKPAFRIIVNSPATQGAIGSTTGLDPALTLGCGAPGGSITSDNVSPLHLIHTRRIAFDIRSDATPVFFGPKLDQNIDVQTSAFSPQISEESISRIVREIVDEKLKKSR